MSLWARFFGGKPPKESAEALRRGITVAEVERALPMFDRRNHFTHLKSAKCVAYSVPRSRPGNPGRFAFLMRDVNAGAQYANGWLFSCEDGAPPPQLHKVLQDIANAWDEELLEFEVDETRVTAFWYEWGGVSRVDQIERWLRQLRDAAGGTAVGGR